MAPRVDVSIDVTLVGVAQRNVFFATEDIVEIEQGGLPEELVCYRIESKLPKRLLLENDAKIKTMSTLLIGVKEKLDTMERMKGFWHIPTQKYFLFQPENWQRMPERETMLLEASLPCIWDSLFMLTNRFYPIVTLRFLFHPFTSGLRKSWRQRGEYVQELGVPQEDKNLFASSILLHLRFSHTQYMHSISRAKQGMDAILENYAGEKYWTTVSLTQE